MHETRETGLWWEWGKAEREVRPENFSEYWGFATAI